MTCIPGIFAITLNVYYFLFEKQRIADASLYVQVLPIISMAITLWLIRKNVDFKDIPGFEKLGGLITILAAVIIFMWILEKTRIFVFTMIPFGYFILFFIILLVLIRVGWKKMAA